MKGTVQFNGNLSEPFNMCSRIKQGCVLAPTLFGIFFALLLRHAFGTAQEGIYLQTGSDGSLFNLAHLKLRTKVCEALIRDMLFADDAAVMTHTQRELQLLMDCFSQGCKDFRLIISLKKTNVLGQDIPAPPVITINNYELEVIHQFMYLGSTITDNLSLDPEIDKRIWKAATTLACLTSRVWTNPKLTLKMKMAVYNACILSTLLYGSETWTTYAHQEKRLNTFHLRSLQCNLASHGKTRWPTLMSCLMLASPPCTPCWDNIGCTGLAMSTIWRMAKFQKTSSMESLPQGREALAFHSWGTRMHARETWRHSTSTSIPGRTSLPTAPAGVAHFINSCRPAKRSWQQWQQRSKPHKRKQQPTDQSQCTDATYATKIATLTLVSTATEDAVQAEQTVWTSNRWIIIIHGQPWPTESYYYI